MIAVEGLVKDFGRTRAVAGVSFHVAAGEIMGLLGPNGSGKTTIMRILTGFFPPTAGNVAIDGLDVERHPLAVRERIGYLPENVVLYPDLTVVRFLRFCAEVKGVPASARRARLDEVIAACGLTEVAGKLIGKLSKGYRQRVGIAQAIVHRPRVLILDEPTVGLDPRQIIEIRTLITSLAGSTTVLLSTHILPEVSMTCGRVIIIDYGRIIAEDTALGLTQRVRGSDETRVRVVGPRPEVLAALATVTGVDELREEAATDGAVTVVARSTRGDDVRRDIAALVVGRGWGLVEMRPLAMSLEDLFVRLVRDDRDAAA
ncbi:MAG: ABC transporter ATP-binding protein [Deltaproteobacteria bacterium]|nr:MAG: ABC transporter ATP-binding protein [Deltaproteobacteria bacterium]